MAILKLNKKIAYVLILLTCITSVMFWGYYQQKQKDIVDSQECKNSLFVAQNSYSIHLYKYDLKELIDLKANILRNGKVIKTFYKTDKKDKSLYFEYDNLMKSDTIMVKIKNDVYYIHSFENDYWLGYQPQKCFLNSYKINTYLYVEPRHANYGEEYSDSSPSNKEFYLERETLK